MSEEKETKIEGARYNIWGNSATMNFPTLLLKSIQSSQYFKSLL